MSKPKYKYRRPNTKYPTTFGRYLQAYRIGFRLDKRKKMWIRLGTDENRTFCHIQLVPEDWPEKLPNGKGKFYVCWWDDNSAILDLIPGFHGIMNITKPFDFYVDIETGQKL